MKEGESEGLLLQTIPYLGRKKILKVFTEKEGLLTLITSLPKASPLTTPFCLATWIYRKGEKEISPLVDADLLDPLLHLKDDFAHLMQAGQMAQDLLRTQLPEKKAVSLYQLARLYLKVLPTFPKGEVLTASFRLKLLSHDGLLSLTPYCSQCRGRATGAFEGESFCDTDLPLGGLTFSPREWEILLLLTYTKRLDALREVDELPSDRIALLFEERMGKR